MEWRSDGDGKTVRYNGDYTMHRRSVFTALVAATSAMSLAANPAADIVRAFMSKNAVPGMAYAVIVKGSIVAHGTYGVSDLKTKEKITDDSVFPIASLSKPFVAMGVLALVEKGSLKIDDPIGEYLPDLPEAWKPLKIVRLLDHTSGVPDHINSNAFNWRGREPIGSEELIKKLVSLPLRFKAGERYEYSNGNYVLLAKLIERVSGQPYEKFLESRIFEPLGMKHTRALTLENLPSAVHGHANGLGGVLPATFNPDWCYGNGGLGSSILDLAKLDWGLYTPRILKSSTLSFVTTPQPLSDGRLVNYAMGWMVGRLRGARAISHSGRLNGWQSYFVRYADYNATVVVLSNHRDVSLANLANDLAGTVIPNLTMQPITDAYPSLTNDHRGFIESILTGKVDESRLDGDLLRDYRSKDRWSGLKEDLRKGARLTVFEPVSRRQTGADAFTSSYRLELGNRVWKVDLGWNGAGLINMLTVSGA
ncbi:class A beta-lactamase-related serine hydrolase [bacterium]|nr:MAG: class A beta-lactamase-related serine hydrolase [bacterium]